MSAFGDLQILDFSTGIAGPYAGMFFADHGADVVKMPASSSPIRRLYPTTSAARIAASLRRAFLATAEPPSRFCPRERVRPVAMKSLWRPRERVVLLFRG